MTRYFVDTQGVYIGGFDGAEPPAGAVEVATAPADARQTWNGTAWSAAPPMATPIDAVAWLQRLSPTTQQGIAAAALSNPAVLLWVVKAAGAQNGIVVTDPEVIAGVSALVGAGVLTANDQATLLAP